MPDALGSAAFRNPRFHPSSVALRYSLFEVKNAGLGVHSDWAKPEREALLGRYLEKYKRESSERYLPLNPRLLPNFSGLGFRVEDKGQKDGI